MGGRTWAGLVAAIVGVSVWGGPHLPRACAQGSSGVDVHGFVSQGALLSTGNEYMARSTRGNLEFFEAAINVSTEVVDRLRVGVQLFTRDLGPIGNYTSLIDWAYLDYRWREWLGLRAGRIKLPYGLYNEFVDVDSSRLSILLPQGMYPTRSRDFLLAETGVSLYGSRSLGGAGGLDYQIAFGSIYLDPKENPLVVDIDSQYAAAAQLYYRPPLPGLRLGISALVLQMVFDFRFDAATAAALRMAGVAPANFTGALKYEYDDVNLVVASLEYVAHGWLIAAEYARTRGATRLTPVIPMLDYDPNDENLYGILAYRLTDWLEAGGFYAVHFKDAADRNGTKDPIRFNPAHRAYQRDLALSLRFDFNEHWLFKLEGHYMVGTAEMLNNDITLTGGAARLTRSWGLFLAKTTVSF